VAIKTVHAASFGLAAADASSAMGTAGSGMLSSNSSTAVVGSMLSIDEQRPVEVVSNASAVSAPTTQQSATQQQRNEQRENRQNVRRLFEREMHLLSKVSSTHLPASACLPVLLFCVLAHLTSFCLVSQLRHPNCIMLMGAYVPSADVSTPVGTEVSDDVVIVTEYMKGGSLADVLRDNPTLVEPMKTRLTILLDTARGISYLHHHKPPILHCDLKVSDRTCLLTFHSHAHALFCSFAR
jgi:serine/threonine protein kinase